MLGAATHVSSGGTRLDLAVPPMSGYVIEKRGPDTDAIAKEIFTRSDWIWDYYIEKGIEDARDLLADRNLDHEFRDVRYRLQIACHINSFPLCAEDR